MNQDLDAGILQCRILILDDERPNVRLLERILGDAGYVQVLGITDSRGYADVVREFRPDIVLLDLHMPYVSGFDILRETEKLVETDEYLPVIVITADVTQETRDEALGLGATDFLTKPFNRAEVRLRIRNQLCTRLLHERLRRQNAVLDQKVRERTRDLSLAHEEILSRLARAAEFRDDDTGLHTQRVGQIAERVAGALNLDPAEAGLIGKAAPLHDLGKIGIPDAILLKPGKLTPEEFDRMKAHTLIGARILDGTEVPLLKLARTIALTHHERWDGTGYPHGVAGHDIPVAGRIVAVADVFDALCSERPYKPSMIENDAWRIMREQRGRHFDPRLCDVMEDCTEQFIAIRQEFPDQRVECAATGSAL
jgi:putative two-component system response regulator